MKVLLTGATGYIGKRLLPELIRNGHEIVCLVRDKDRFHIPQSFSPFVSTIEANLNQRESLEVIPKNIDAAYYLVHSMATETKYQEIELEAATNFKHFIEQTNALQVIYLSGIVNNTNLSPHLQSRKNVEIALSSEKYALTTLRAGIIIGSGSASYEIIRDLVEKLPIMITPKWLSTRCQPIAIADVISFLSKSLLNESTYNCNFDIGGPDQLTYKQMLLEFASIRKLKRYIHVVPIMTPRLSSYWLYFITAIPFKLATALVDSMKIEVICRYSNINQLLNVQPMTYTEAIKAAFSELKDEQIISSWKDALNNGMHELHLSDLIEVPSFGCFTDKRIIKTINPAVTLEKIWRIGGYTGWHYANWLWQLRGFIDRINGGVGLRRGRTNRTKIKSGDVIDFWRVLYADKTEGRLLLYAEMKLPGEAWLEFKLIKDELTQTATFRPKGLIGRLYWLVVWPLHHYIFNGMIKQLSKQIK